ncbi:MAG TPA: GAF domain-containing protein [Candidatus Dormibacteraeota bacterium]|nr:GAF domain-containing protein [Candidatus Dormibacteraeota bacterium]
MNQSTGASSIPGFDDLPGALIAYDGQGRVTRANRAALQILGFASEGDIVGSNAGDAGWFRTDSAGWPDSENLHPALAAIRSRQPERGILARCTRPDGSEVWVQVDAVPLPTASDAEFGVLLTLADVTPILTDMRLPRPRYGDDALAEVTNQLASARLDPDAILSTVTSTLSRLRAGTWIAVLMQKDPAHLKVVAANEADPLIARYVEDMHLSEKAPMLAMSNRVIESGESILMPSVPYEEFLSLEGADLREYIEKVRPPRTSPIHFLGVLVVPMRARGATVGTLGLFERRSSNPLSDHDIRWLQAIADRTGLAAENAQLYVDAISRLERLTALRNVGLAITGSPDLRLTLRVILDQVTAGLGVDAADVLLLDPKDGNLALAASTGFQSTAIPDYRLPVDETLPGRTMLGRRIETVTALGAFTQFRRRSLFAREGFKSYGAVPLIARAKLAGVLEVFHRSQLQPDQEWLEFLEALGSDASIAIDNAGMFDQLQKAGPAAAAGTRASAPDLSRLEKEILALVVEGHSNRLIAERVHLSQNTVKFHVAQLLQKLDAGNRTELAYKATREGWL